VYIERQQWLSIALDVALPYVWEGSVFAKLIRGVWSRFVQTRSTPVARQRLIPNLSRDAAAFLCGIGASCTFSPRNLLVLLNRTFTAAFECPAADALGAHLQVVG
jgi:hypothetical protein